MTMTQNIFPPTVSILLDENLNDCDSAEDLKLKLSDKGLMADLCNQAKWSQDNFDYFDKRSDYTIDEFRLSPSASMNPFHYSGKCHNQECYEGFVNKFAKTLCLFSDQVILTDSFTKHFIHLQGIEFNNISDYFFIHLKNQLSALKFLQPLIEKNIITLAKPLFTYCESCYNKQLSIIDTTSINLLNRSKHLFKFDFIETPQGGLLAYKNPLITSNEDHEVRNTLLIKDSRKLKEIQKALKIEKTKKKNRAIFDIFSDQIRRNLQENIYDVIHDVGLAQKTNSIYSSGSRLENLFLKEVDENCPNIDQIDYWEKLRSIDLPYIDQLSIEDILILREEAGKSLYSFRTFISKALRESSTHSESNIPDIATDLRGQVVELQNEISSLNIAKNKRYQFGMSGIGISFVIYGLYSGDSTITATSFASLLATLAHLRGEEKECEKNISLIKSKPAYTLFKAKEILKNKKNS
jgi:hypothetical protein